MYSHTKLIYSNQNRIIALSAISTKVSYSLIMLRYTYLTRYLLSIGISSIGVIILYFGIIHINLFFVYFSAALVGSGNTSLCLTFYMYLKHYPNGLLSTYIIGDYSGGIFVICVYFVVNFLKMPLEYVSFTTILLIPSSL